MREATSDAGRKLLALGVLLVAAYVLFKLVVGFITSIAVIAVVVARRRGGHLGAARALSGRGAPWS